MGYYIQPAQRTKESWLEEHARVKLGTKVPLWTEIPPDCLAIAMVDNGIFTAAAIAIDEQAYKQYSAPTKRKVEWFFVPTSKVLDLEPSIAGIISK